MPASGGGPCPRSPGGWVKSARRTLRSRSARRLRSIRRRSPPAASPCALASPPRFPSVGQVGLPSQAPPESAWPSPRRRTGRLRLPGPPRGLRLNNAHCIQLRLAVPPGNAPLARLWCRRVFPAALNHYPLWVRHHNRPLWRSWTAVAVFLASADHPTREDQPFAPPTPGLGRPSSPHPRSNPTPFALGRPTWPPRTVCHLLLESFAVGQPAHGAGYCGAFQGIGGYVCVPPRKLRCEAMPKHGRVLLRQERKEN